MHFPIQSDAKINFECIYKEYFKLSKQNEKPIFKNILNCVFKILCR